MEVYYEHARAQYEAEKAILANDARLVTKLLELPSALHLNWDKLAKLTSSTDPLRAEVTRLVAYYSPAKVTWASLFSTKFAHEQISQHQHELMTLVDLAFAHDHFQPLIDLPISTMIANRALDNYDRLTFIYREHLVRHALPKLIQLDSEGDAGCKIDIQFLAKVLANESKYDTQLMEFLENELFSASATVIDNVHMFQVHLLEYISTGTLAKKLWYAREFTLTEVKEHITMLYNPKSKVDHSADIAIFGKLAKLNLARLKDLKLAAIQKASK